MSGDEFFRQPEPKPMNKYEVLDRDLARINTQIYSLNSTRGSMSPKAGMYREQELERLHKQRDRIHTALINSLVKDNNG